MTIDPMAAVSSVTGSPAADAGAVTSGAAASPTQPVSQVQAPAEVSAADQGAKMDLFDYSARHRNAPPAIDTLQPESKADYLANPAALGEKVLQRMETLHQRSVDYHHQLQTGPAPAAAGSEGTMAGPASAHVAGSAKTATTDPTYAGLMQMFDYAVETKMVSMASSQFVSAVNTLMKGQ
ncbi:MAG: hypothetical protein R3F54_12625 [Alphaproteobacteria bacterium]